MFSRAPLWLSMAVYTHLCCKKLRELVDNKQLVYFRLHDVVFGSVRKFQKKIA